MRRDHRDRPRFPRAAEPAGGARPSPVPPELLERLLAGLARPTLGPAEAVRVLADLEARAFEIALDVCYVRGGGFTDEGLFALVERVASHLRRRVGLDRAARAAVPAVAGATPDEEPTPPS